MIFVAGKKKLDRKQAEHLAGILRPIVKERFDGNQTEFAKAAGISQSQASSILRVGGGDRSVGINVLIRLRDYLGTMSIDEMLNLPPLRSRPTVVPPDALEEAVFRAMQRLPERVPVRLPPAVSEPVVAPKRRKAD